MARYLLLVYLPLVLKRVIQQDCLTPRLETIQIV